MAVKETISTQLNTQKRSVSYDVYDMTVQQLTDMVAGDIINIAPDYQRHFVWKDDRESELIESIFLGIPVPSLYMAANRDGTWEVVDGVQRLSTLLHFCSTLDEAEKLGRKSSLVLQGLKKLTTFNGRAFAQLPRPTQLYFVLRPMRTRFITPWAPGRCAPGRHTERLDSSSFGHQPPPPTSVRTTDQEL